MDVQAITDDTEGEDRHGESVAAEVWRPKDLGQRFVSVLFDASAGTPHSTGKHVLLEHR